jgi:hypothetical protein
MAMRLSGMFALLQRKPSRLNASDVEHFGKLVYDPKIRDCFEKVLDVRYLALLYPDELSACVPDTV